MTKDDVKGLVTDNIRESEFGRRLPGVTANTQQFSAVLKELVYKAQLADVLDSIIDLTGAAAAGGGRFGVEDRLNDANRLVYMQYFPLAIMDAGGVTISASDDGAHPTFQGLFLMAPDNSYLHWAKAVDMYSSLKLSDEGSVLKANGDSAHGSSSHNASLHVTYAGSYFTRSDHTGTFGKVFVPNTYTSDRNLAVSVNGNFADATGNIVNVSRFAIEDSTSTIDRSIDFANHNLSFINTKTAKINAQGGKVSLIVDSIQGISFKNTKANQYWIPNGNVTNGSTPVYLPLTVNNLFADANGNITTTAYNLPISSESVLGGVMIGSGLAVDGNGVLSASGGAYNLPISSASVLGGVMIGSGLAVDDNGVLSASGGPAAASRFAVIGEDFTATENRVFDLDGHSLSFGNGTIYSTAQFVSTAQIQGSSFVVYTTGGGVVQINSTTDDSVNYGGLISIKDKTSSNAGIITAGALTANTHLLIPNSPGVDRYIPVSVNGVYAGLDGNIIIAAGSAYTLPKASTSVLGGVKVGSGLAVDANGVLTAAVSVPIATTSVIGGFTTSNSYTGLSYNSSTGLLKLGISQWSVVLEMGATQITTGQISTYVNASVPRGGVAVFLDKNQGTPYEFPLSTSSYVEIVANNVIIANPVDNYRIYNIAAGLSITNVILSNQNLAGFTPDREITIVNSSAASVTLTATSIITPDLYVASVGSTYVSTLTLEAGYAIRLISFQTSGGNVKWMAIGKSKKSST